MTLSKKHFKAIAEILAKNNADYDLINDFVGYFLAENPLFDEGVFCDYIDKKRAEALTEVLRED